MTLYDFILADEMEQAEAIWSGTHIGNREDDEHRILLYKIDEFYVEVFYNKEHNFIRKFRPFNSLNQLLPYYGKINIPEFNN